MAQGIGRLALAGVPYILSLITIIIIILIFVAGNKPGALEDLALLKVSRQRDTASAMPL